MAIADYLAQWRAEGPALLGSVVAVTLMVLAAAALGFRKLATLDESALARLAAAEGASVEHAVIAPNGRDALARLSGGKVMIARVMGNDVSARVAPAGALRLKLGAGQLSATFADLGFPPLNMRLQDAPAWLHDLAGGGGQE
ncbi:MAG: hypothetical protein ACREH4_04200 [Vitreimonas sp.]